MFYIDDAAPCMMAEDPDLWFSDVIPEVKQAKAECMKCPMRIACAQEGMDEEYGVWGGLSVWERTQLRRQQRRLSLRVVS